MDQADIVPIPLVGFRNSPVGQELEHGLRKAGYPVLALRDRKRIPALLVGLPNAMVGISDQGEPGAAEQALAAARQTYCGGAVVVVAQHSDFSQYYALMNQGAVGYFEAQEPPALIFAGVTRAARQATRYNRQ